jgi:hypothetical protein
MKKAGAWRVVRVGVPGTPIVLEAGLTTVKAYKLALRASQEDPQAIFEIQDADGRTVVRLKAGGDVTLMDPLGIR